MNLKLYIGPDNRPLGKNQYNIHICKSKPRRTMLRGFFYLCLSKLVYISYTNFTNCIFLIKLSILTFKYTLAVIPFCV